MDRGSRAGRWVAIPSLLLLIAGVWRCALSDGDPCSNSTDCRTGYLCYWTGTEGCTQGECHQPRDLCGGPTVLACGCDGKPARFECGSPGYDNQVSSLDAQACGIEAGVDQ